MAEDTGDGQEGQGLPDLSGSVGALSAAVLGAALDMAGMAAVITDAALDPPGPVIRYSNAHFEAISGYTAAELIGRTPRLLQGPRTDRTVLSSLRHSLADRQHFVGTTVNYRKDGSAYLNEWIVSAILGTDGAVTHWLSIQRDATEDGGVHPRAEAMRQRMEAMLGAVRAIAARTLGTPEEAGVFDDRLAALGRAQGLAGRSGAGLETLLRAELEPLRPALRGVTLDGPAVTLPDGVAAPLGLALHELAVNATRHGALAVPDGQLSVTWQLAADDGDRRLLIQWTERGAVLPDASDLRRGYGRQVVEEALTFALGGRTRLRLERDGLSCRIELPLGDRPGSGRASA